MFHEAGRRRAVARFSRWGREVSGRSAALVPVMIFRSAAAVQPLTPHRRASRHRPGRRALDRLRNRACRRHRQHPPPPPYRRPRGAYRRAPRRHDRRDFGSRAVWLVGCVTSYRAVRRLARSPGSDKSVWREDCLRCSATWRFQSTGRCQPSRASSPSATSGRSFTRNHRLSRHPIGCERGRGRSVSHDGGSDPATGRTWSVSTQASWSAGTEAETALKTPSVAPGHDGGSSRATEPRADRRRPDGKAWLVHPCRDHRPASRTSPTEASKTAPAL